MPKWINKSDEKRWKEAVNIVKKDTGKSKSKFKDDDWGLTMHIFKKMQKANKRKNAQNLLGGNSSAVELKVRAKMISADINLSNFRKYADPINPESEVPNEDLLENAVGAVRALADEVNSFDKSARESDKTLDYQLSKFSTGLNKALDDLSKLPSTQLNFEKRALLSESKNFLNAAVNGSSYEDKPDFKRWVSRWPAIDFGSLTTLGSAAYDSIVKLFRSFQPKDSSLSEIKSEEQKILDSDIKKIDKEISDLAYKIIELKRYIPSTPRDDEGAELRERYRAEITRIISEIEEKRFARKQLVDEYNKTGKKYEIAPSESAAESAASSKESLDQLRQQILDFKIPSNLPKDEKIALVKKLQGLKLKLKALVESGDFPRTESEVDILTPNPPELGAPGSRTKKKPSDKSESEGELEDEPEEKPEAPKYVPGPKERARFGLPAQMDLKSRIASAEVKLIALDRLVDLVENNEDFKNNAEIMKLATQLNIKPDSKLTARQLRNNLIDGLNSMRERLAEVSEELEGSEALVDAVAKRDLAEKQMKDALKAKDADAINSAQKALDSAKADISLLEGSQQESEEEQKKPESPRLSKSKNAKSKAIVEKEKASKQLEDAVKTQDTAAITAAQKAMDAADLSLAEADKAIAEEVSKETAKPAGAEPSERKKSYTPPTKEAQIDLEIPDVKLQEKTLDQMADDLGKGITSDERLRLSAKLEALKAENAPEDEINLVEQQLEAPTVVKSIDAAKNKADMTRNLISALKRSAERVADDERRLRKIDTEWRRLKAIDNEARAVEMGTGRVENKSPRFAQLEDERSRLRARVGKRSDPKSAYRKTVNNTLDYIKSIIEGEFPDNTQLLEAGLSYNNKFGDAGNADLLAIADRTAERLKKFVDIGHEEFSTWAIPSRELDKLKEQARRFKQGLPIDQQRLHNYIPAEDRLKLATERKAMRDNIEKMIDLGASRDEIAEARKALALYTGPKYNPTKTDTPDEINKKAAEFENMVSKKEEEVSDLIDHKLPYENALSVGIGAVNHFLNELSPAGEAAGTEIEDLSERRETRLEREKPAGYEEPMEFAMEKARESAQAVKPEFLPELSKTKSYTSVRRDPETGEMIPVSKRTSEETASESKAKKVELDVMEAGLLPEELRVLNLTPKERAKMREYQDQFIADSKTRKPNRKEMISRRLGIAEKSEAITPEQKNALTDAAVKRSHEANAAMFQYAKDIIPDVTPGDTYSVNTFFIIKGIYDTLNKHIAKTSEATLGDLDDVEKKESEQAALRDVKSHLEDQLNVYFTDQVSKYAETLPKESTSEEARARIGRQTSTEKALLALTFYLEDIVIPQSAAGIKPVLTKLYWAARSRCKASYDIFKINRKKERPVGYNPMAVEAPVKQRVRKERELDKRLTESEKPEGEPK